MSAVAGVVTALATCRKAVQLYPPTHPAHAEAIQSLVDAVGESTAQGPCVLNLYQGRLYHESVALPTEVHGTVSIAEAFESRRIESLTFTPGFSAEDALGLTEVLTLRPSPDLVVEDELASRGVQSVIAALLEDDDEEKEERDRQREADRAMYQRVIAMLRQLRERFAQGHVGDLAQTTRLVAGVIERLASDPAAVMGLATMRSTGEHNLFHSLNVMILATAMGQELGLSDEELSSLGLSALLHDVGKAAFDVEDFSQAEAMMLMHPKVGAEILQRVALEDPAPLLVAYEHHMHFDGGGWPERDSDRIPHPYSRMVAIANRYENLTNPADGVEALTPDKALIEVLREANTALDPFFVRLFAKTLGVFPIGSLVRLSDQSVGVVARQTEDPLSPVVRIVYDTKGIEIDDPVDMELAGSGLSILEVVDPEVLRLEVADKL
jgi:putative nucleotidyltransferase with HDIG domain